MTSGAAAAAHAISGSSALATTVQFGADASASRHLRATSQISAARSIWSRLRFSSATTRALVAVSTAGRDFSSVSSTAIEAWGARPSAAGNPASMFAPNAFEATSRPGAPSAPGARRGGEEPGGSGLAVGPGHQADLAVGREQAQQAGLHPQADPPADHRSVPAAGQA